MPPTIRPLASADAPACDAIIAGLPYFFGDPGGVRDCAAAVRSQPGFVAEIDEVRAGGRLAGFITLMQHMPGSAEITWMAVHTDHRRSGIGRALIDAAVAWAREHRLAMLFVLTLGPSVPEEPGDNYEGTRAFYRAAGFTPLREFGLRDWNDAFALVLARAIA